MTTHAISATYTRFDRMSPTAAALAVLLHVVVGLALWWLPQLQPFTEPKEDAIDVTIEQPPPPPEPAPPAVPQDKPPVSAPPPPQASRPAPPKGGQSSPLGLPPPSPTTGETNKQSTATKEEARQPESKPAPQPDQGQQPQQQQQALAPKEPAPAPTPPAPPLERALPPLEAPPPPLTSKDFPKPPPPPPPAPQHPQARTAPPPAPNQPLRPSPLTNPAPKRAPSEPQSNAPSATFVNPADQFTQAKIVEQYLWQVANKISQYRYYSNQANEQGVVVLRLVIARDGRLLDASIARSSGIVNLDKGVLDAARAAAPYAPFPEGIPGAQQPFILPLSSVYRR